eukprot:4310320-Prorocentrum_lima.AAC.1
MVVSMPTSSFPVAFASLLVPFKMIHLRTPNGNTAWDETSRMLRLTAQRWQYCICTEAQGPRKRR